ncbi:MAG: cbb3-type cytochrome c oxidase subunit I [Actinobacteria bacterium]|nr:cbb3-type cytochrome c oxidase subunit I [Actinomycetota bacterium]MBI3686557.1 cbb3-type cytochrome c oxidase subunit I [Actinomycetota bacterium]
MTVHAPPPETATATTATPVVGTHLPPEPTSVESDLARAHAIAGLVLLLGAAAFGIMVATKFTAPQFLGDRAALTWGRLRFAHTQGILYAWLMNGFFAFAYYAVPTLSGRPVLSRALGWWLFWIWNVGVVLLGWVMVLSGTSQSVEWGEFPIVVDVITLGAFLGFVAQFLAPYLRRPRAGLYVASWYYALALTFTPVAFVIGQFVPEYFAPGAIGAILSGLWIHDAVGLLVTPMSLAIAYYVIPAVTGRPIFSHFMSLTGFWGLVFFYPLNGIHHYVFSPIPMHTQQIAIMASIFMGLTVIVLVANLLLSLRGCARLTMSNVALRFVWVGTVFYLLVSLQGSFQAAMPVQEQIHFTDFVIGHSHLAMAGFATFIIIGGILHAWPRIAGRPFHARYAHWAFWVATIALVTMVGDLTIVGMQQAGMWISGASWIDSVVASRSAWMIRTVSGTFLAVAFVLLLVALLRRPGAEDTEEAPAGAVTSEPVAARGAVVSA